MEGASSHLVVVGVVESKEGLEGFVKENTLPGSSVVTDVNSAYGDLGDRLHFVRNLSVENALPAHIELPASTACSPI